MLNDARFDLGGLTDLPEVIALADSVPGLPSWPEDAWQTYVDPHRALGGGHNVLLTARASDGTLLGFLVADGFEETVELALVLVCPSRRQQGVGKKLLSFWFGWAWQRGAREAVLEVRASNSAAIHLYSTLGFVTEGRRRAYYREPSEDALFMRTTIGRAGSGVDSGARG